MTRKMGKRTKYLFIVGLLIIVLLLVPQFLPEYMTMVFTRVLILSIVAMSLDLLIGYTGIAAIGHAAFFAIGGYTTALMATRLNASFG